MYGKPFGQDTRCYQRTGVNGAMIKSLCWMILKKGALPLGLDGKSYWEAMLLGFINNKFCSHRANFKQELLEQFQGKLLHREICHNNAHPEIVFFSTHKKMPILSCRTNGQVVFYTKSPMTSVFCNANFVVLCFIFRHEVCFVFYFKSRLRLSFWF